MAVDHQYRRRMQRAGRASYPIEHLQVGGSIVFPWYEDVRAMYQLRNCVKRKAKRRGWRLSLIPESYGLRVRRDA